MAEFSLLWMLKLAPDLAQLSLQVGVDPLVLKFKPGLNRHLGYTKYLRDAVKDFQGRSHEINRSEPVTVANVETNPAEARPKEHVYCEMQH